MLPFFRCSSVFHLCRFVASLTLWRGASGEDGKLPFSVSRPVCGAEEERNDRETEPSEGRRAGTGAEMGEKEKYLSSFRGSKVGCPMLFGCHAIILTLLVQQQVLKGAAFKEYATKLREKSTQFKQLKQEMDHLLADLGIAQRTEQVHFPLYKYRGLGFACVVSVSLSLICWPQVLRTRLSETEGKVTVMEQKRGVAGYQQTQAKLEEVSAKKSEVDEGKERMLGEISRVVQEINVQIKARCVWTLLIVLVY